MNRNIIAAIIVAVGLVLAAFLLTGRYYVLRVDADTVVRMDRWTGETKVIETDEADEWLSDAAPIGSTMTVPQSGKASDVVTEDDLNAADNAAANSN